MRSGYDRFLLLAGILAAIVAVVALRIFDPALSGIFPPCPLHALTGWYCPGCGSLRALHQLLNGHIAGAFAMNPFAVIALPFLCYGLASQAGYEIRGRYLPHFFIPGTWIWAMAAVIVAFGVARNIAAYPFNLLAPGAMLGLKF
jgi:hypothetical protein